MIHLGCFPRFHGMVWRPIVSGSGPYERDALHPHNTHLRTYSSSSVCGFIQAHSFEPPQVYLWWSVRAFCPAWIVAHTQRFTNRIRVSRQRFCNGCVFLHGTTGSKESTFSYAPAYAYIASIIGKVRTLGSNVLKRGLQALQPLRLNTS